MGKVIKHTEYYCDICEDKIQISWEPFAGDKFYKVKCYDYEGKRVKCNDYSYVCIRCMRSLVKKIEEEEEEEKGKGKKNA